MASLARTAVESIPDSGGEPTEDVLLPDNASDARQPEGLLAVDRRLVALCRERGPLRAVLARIAWRLVVLRAWERIPYARLSDYAVERLGLSARWVQSLAEVGAGFRAFPRLEEALVSGTLGWTKVRLLARLPPGSDEARWIDRARRLTAEQLSKTVRAVDRGSFDGGAPEEDEWAARSHVFEIRCSPAVRWKWYAARGAAARAAGHMLQVGDAAELIAAEVLSALPIDEHAEQAGCDQANVSRLEPSEAEDAAGPDAGDPASASEPSTAPPDTAQRPPGQAYGALEPLVAGLDQADAFELDDRFRRALALEQRLDAQVGRLLALVWGRWAHRVLGYATRDAYARERLGMDPTRARALVRLEHAAVRSEQFARAYRSGALSWVKAGILAPLVSADPLGLFMKDWVAWAERVTVRRLRDDVEWALALEETDPAAFHCRGGLPPEAGGQDREIGAPRTDAAPLTTPPPDEHESCTVRFFAPADVVRLFRAVLCTVRRRMESDDGRLPTEGQALGAMLDHVLASWALPGGKVPARHRIFDRDGWRCAVPGCTSMQNLHEHHIRFRSAGGTHAPENRITLCAFHHLRGIHAERLRCAGRAPDGLTWQIGIRPGAAPLAVYRSGDLEVPRPRAIRS